MQLLQGPQGQIYSGNIRFKSLERKKDEKREEKKEGKFQWKQAKISDRLKGSCRVLSERSTGKGHCALPISEDVSDFFRQKSLAINEKFSLLCLEDASLN